MDQPRTYSLKCPSCGAGLKISATIESFACAFCGASVGVSRGGGVVSLDVLADSLNKVKGTTERAAAELALARLPREIEEKQAELKSLGIEIGRLECDLARAKRPPKKVAFGVKSGHIIGAALSGSGVGLFMGVLVGLFTNGFFGLIAGFVVTVVFALRYFQSDSRTSARSQAERMDSEDSYCRMNVDSNMRSLQALKDQRRSVLDRLESLKAQRAKARKVVENE